MWCEKCNQDVPGISARRADGGIVCARCGVELSDQSAVRLDTAHTVTTNPAPAADTPNAPPVATVLPPLPVSPDYVGTSDHGFVDDGVDWDDAPWIPNDDLVRAKIAVNSYQSYTRDGVDITVRSPLQDSFDQQQDLGHQADFRRHDAVPGDLDRSKSGDHQLANGSSIRWFGLCAGIAVFAFGGILTSWSLFSNRPDLWRIGLPSFLFGQAILMLGLVFQLERLWQSHRRIESSLSDHYEGRKARESATRNEANTLR